MLKRALKTGTILTSLGMAAWGISAAYASVGTTGENLLSYDSEFSGRKSLEDQYEPASGGGDYTLASLMGVKGTPYIDVRYHYEFVDQDNFDKNAHSSTIRTRAGYTTPEILGLQMTVELENVSNVGPEDYNSTNNGRVQFPVVADPTITEINQLNLSYNDIPDTDVKVGRQFIILDNWRFVGDVGWRQNSQTFDAATVSNGSIPDTEIFYGFVDQVNRIFGRKNPNGTFNGDTHLMNASYYGLEDFGVLTGYSYLVDLENGAALSSQTYGASFSGVYELNDDWSLVYRAEYANQSDYQRNPIDYNADYYHFKLGVKFKDLTVKLGYEELGSDDGLIGFSTPLGTLHKFNGWADIFLATPAQGLEDRHIHVVYDINDVHEWIDDTRIRVRYHDFNSDVGGINFGTEVDFDLMKRINEHHAVGVQYDNYNADNFAQDVEKFTFIWEIKY